MLSLVYKVMNILKRLPVVFISGVSDAIEILVGYWKAFQWSPTGRVEIKLAILWL